MLAGNNRIVYLPIEVAVREFDSRVLLTHHLLRAGFRVVLGQQWLLTANIDHMPAGTVFYKGLNRTQYQWMRGAVANGHRVVGINEEATALAHEHFLRKDIEYAALDILDTVFVQGDHQHKVYQNLFPQHLDKLKVAGNPRWDLLRPDFRRFYEKEAQVLRAEHGPFILVNSNFGYYNTAWGSHRDFVQVCLNIGYIDLNDPVDQRWIRDELVFEEESYKHFVAMTLRLRDEFPGHKIIVRPHPSERNELWEQALAGQDRIQVASTGSAIPWILASEVLVHNTCTTGIEAMLLDHPTLAYVPYQNWCADVFLSNLVNERHTELDTLIARTREILADPRAAGLEQRARFRPVLEQHYAQLDGKLSAECIAERLAEITPEPSWPGFQRSDRPLVRAIKRTEYQIKKIAVTPQEFGRRLVEMSEVLRRNVRVLIDTIGDSLFLIQPN